MQGIHAGPFPRCGSNGLGRGSFGPSGARAVAEAACLAGVIYLDLSGDDVGDAGAVALAASPHLERLRLLDLSDEPLGAAAQAALHGRFGSRVKL